ncbi:MAG: DNA polymerase II large subunit, partial [Candidatus Hadarchaeota archaeon]|nr:DNA polymerase II large subunit [Candidatus Hadarchaeota archaeon]
MENYFGSIDGKLNEVYEIAKKARSLGLDPELEPEIPRAEDLAARVEKLVGPPGVAKEIRKLEKELPREELGLKMAEMIMDGRFGRFEDVQAAEQAIRTSLAIITEGIAAAAPIEGITHVEIKKNFDGSSYLALYFAGPIRSAGGTAAALAVLAGDFVRRSLYLDAYKPTDREVGRFVEEVDLYASDVTHLQYTPSADDVRKAVSNIPVEITGEPTEQITVTGYLDLERIQTNRIRGGAVLALVEGVLQKAPKILQHVKKLGIEGWDWLSESLRVSAEEEEERAYPKGDKYLTDVIAGRAVLGYPGREGGFRLRYGRARDTGLAAVGIHPATMRILGDHLAIGTQLKIERPGKAAVVAPVDAIEGPTVKLRDGSVVQVNSVEQADELKDRVSEILFLGDILIGYGEFLENNHPLMPAGYCEEWWSQEVRKALAERSVDMDLGAYLSPGHQIPSPQLAIEISEKLDVPLHPAHTYCFHDIGLEELRELGVWLAGGSPKFEDGSLKQLRVKMDQAPKRVLEILGVPHKVKDDRVIIEVAALPLCRCLGLVEDGHLSTGKLDSVLRAHPAEDVMKVIQMLTRFPIRPKAPTRIGSRMGRPEKAKPRKMSPPPHVLFPIGLRGGSTRSIPRAAGKGSVFVEVARYKCPKCGKITIRRKCP